MDNYMDLLMFGGLSLSILFLFFFILQREKIIERKFAAFELSLEELNKEVFILKKNSKNNLLEKKIAKIENIIESIVDDVRVIEDKNVGLIDAVKKQIQELYMEIKKNKLPDMSFINKNDEDKILNLYKNGHTVEEISRELRIPAGEIELILKFSTI